MAAWRYARVALLPGAGGVIAANVMGWAVAGGAIPQAGLTQDDSIQLATDLAILRHTATSGLVGHFAAFDQAGNFAGDFWSRPESAAPPAGGSLLSIVGDEPMRPGLLGGNDDLGDDWGQTLALAIDRVLKQLKDSEEAASIPTGFGNIATPILAPVVVAIIVGGVALGVIGSVAAWRYLDPGFRTRLAAVRAAADAYQTRVEALKATGIMPPPSPIETANADMIRTAASEGSDTAWIVSGAVVGGIVVGGLALSALRAAVAA